MVLINELPLSLICICCSYLYCSHDQLLLETYVDGAVAYIPVGYNEGWLIIFYLPAVLPFHPVEFLSVQAVLWCSAALLDQHMIT